ncbi:hypothetical protein N0V83_009922 [Neocucurbitaria cava]|uniref:Uncharacterized protein n=1 Tax=Neocucurbitaria cava TaxID=798079 RepID=A0A9W9CI46_9PLEO|nr:hypothetical protein N0V83_009922 [Neocucurbitaria cava]
MEPIARTKNPHPKMKGGFILDSDESDTESSDDGDEDDDSSPTTPSASSQQRASNDRNISRNETSLSKKEERVTVNSHMKTVPNLAQRFGIRPPDSNGILGQKRSGVSAQQRTSYQGEDPRLQNLTFVANTKVAEASSSGSVKSPHVNSKPVQVVPSTSRRPASMRPQREITSNGRSMLQGHAKRVDSARSSQINSPGSSQKVLGDNTKEPSIAGQFNNRSSTRLTPKVQDHVLGAQSPKKGPSIPMAAQVQPPQILVTKQPSQSPWTLSAPVQASDGTPVARSQTQRAAPVVPRSHTKNSGLVTQAVPRNPMTGAIAPMLSVPHDVQQGKKRKIGDTASHSNDDTTPLKKLPVASEGNFRYIISHIACARDKRG